MKKILFLVCFFILISIGGVFILGDDIVPEMSATGTLRERIIQHRLFQRVNTTKAQDMIKTLQIGGVTRTYLVHIPATYDPKKGTQLVLALHGGMGSAENMKQNYGFIQKSDREGFIVVFPNGNSRLSSGKFATWNAGNCCGYSVEKKSDDIAFIRGIIDTMKQQYTLTKIFATGMSNGGMMSYRLACELSDTIDAIAAVAGTDNTISCTPTRSIPIFHIHALDDDHVLYDGGCGPKCIEKSETQFVSVPKTVEKWKNIESCKECTPILTNSGVNCEKYTQCTGGSVVKLCSTTTGGHSWPGTQNLSSTNTLEKSPPSQAINATDEIWKFFAAVK